MNSVAMAQVSWKSHLEEHGYAIVPDVLNQKECHALHEGYWDFFKTLIGVEKDDASTWKRIYKLFPNHGMLFQHWCSGHMQQIWDVRQNKKIHGAFADIWDTEDLTVSFDGCSFGLQPEVTGRGWQNKGWLHLDQSPHRNDFECVQGWVTALGVEKGDATLTVLAGSHKHHAEFGAYLEITDPSNWKKCKGDWFKLAPNHVKWFKDRGCEQKYVECPPGSLVLWDSRTVHAGQCPTRGRKNPKNRIVSYVSMMPQAKLSGREREKKQWAAIRGRMTTHWAAEHVKLFGKWPRTYGAPLPAVSGFIPPLLNARGAYLAGWKDPSKCPLTIVDPVERKKAVDAIVASQDAAKAARTAANKSKKRKRAPMKIFIQR